MSPNLSPPPVQKWFSGAEIAGKTNDISGFEQRAKTDAQPASLFRTAAYKIDIMRS
jgi:hypothetical protein